MTATPKPTYGSQPVPLGKYASVSEAARKMGVTRQEAKRILKKARSDPGLLVTSAARHHLAADRLLPPLP